MRCIPELNERPGLEEGDLACGPHEPLSNRGARFLRDAGERPSRLHNNCSGKHAAMLATCVPGVAVVLVFSSIFAATKAFDELVGGNGRGLRECRQ